MELRKGDARNICLMMLKLKNAEFSHTNYSMLERIDNKFTTGIDASLESLNSVTK